MRTSAISRILNILGAEINPSTLEAQENTLLHYKLSDIDDEVTAAGTTYLGYLDKDGAWYISKITATAVTYVAGSSGYDWSNRASESYVSFDSAF